jgi:molecular chaperone GrpE
MADEDNRPVGKGAVNEPKTAGSRRPESMAQVHPAQAGSAQAESGRGGAANEAEPTIEGLQQELEATRQRAEENWDQLLRARAELENLRRRSQRELENAHKYGIEKFAEELLGVRDSLEMGLAAANEGDSVDVDKLREGKELTLKLLDQVFQKHGIQVVDPVGEKFNPERHEAMAMQPSADQAPNTVLTVIQKGYTLNDRLLRPAMVIVAKGAEA